MQVRPARAARHLAFGVQDGDAVLGVGDIDFAPADGRELWRIPFTTDYDQNIVTAVAADGLLIYSGLSKPTTAVRPVQKGGKWTTEQVWQNADVPMYMSSPVAAGGILYGLTHRNRGQFFALDLQSGQQLWTSPPRQGDNAALVAAGDLLIATTTEISGPFTAQPPSRSPRFAAGRSATP